MIRRTLAAAVTALSLLAAGPVLAQVSFSATYAPASLLQGGSGTIEFNVTNSDETGPNLTGGAFDYAAPMGLTFTGFSPSGFCPVGGGTSVNGSSLHVEGLSADAGFSCVMVLAFTANTEGSYPLAASSLTYVGPTGSPQPMSNGAEPILYVGPPPSVTSLAPATGLIAGGASVVITGTNFTGATSVTFGGTSATFTVTDATHITATSPAHAAGAVDVIVTTPFGSSPNTAADDFSYTVPVPVPTLTEWAMILFAALLALFAAWTIRRRAQAA